MEPEARRPAEGLRIDPVRVGRRRTVVPAAIVAILSVVFVGLALVKPWDASWATVAIASGAPTPQATLMSNAPSARAVSPVVTATPFPAQPTPADLLAASLNHDAWGVRAMVVPGGLTPTGDGSGAGLIERWLAIDVGAGAAWDAGVTGTAVEPGDDVLALGVTTPENSMPLDIRFWRLESDSALRRVVPRPVRGREAGSWLFLPDPREATSLDTWPAGTYRIDVLLGSRIVRLITIVPGDTPVGRGRAPEVGEPPDLVDQLRSFAAGPFAVTPRRPLPIEVSSHDQLDERLAWLGPATGRLEISAIGRVAADPVTGIGVLLKPDEHLVSANLGLVAPRNTEAPDVRIFPLPPVPRSDSERAEGIIIEHADLRPLEPGSYALTESTRLVSGAERTQTWNIEIVPSTPPPPPGNPLASMARWVPLMSDPDHLAGEPLVSERDLGQPDGDGTCGGSANIGTGDELFGIVEPPGFEVGQIRLFAMDMVRSSDVPIRVAPNVIDGLTLVAVPHGGLVAGQYQLIVYSTSPAAPETFLYTVCVGDGN